MYRNPSEPSVPQSFFAASAGWSQGSTQNSGSQSMLNAYRALSPILPKSQRSLSVPENTPFNEYRALALELIDKNSQTVNTLTAVVDEFRQILDSQRIGPIIHEGM